MAYLVFITTLFIVFIEIFVRKVAKQRAAETFDYVTQNHGDALTATFGSHAPNDRGFSKFLFSPETFGDEQVAELKKRTRRVAGLATKPFLILVGLMGLLYVWGAVRGLLNL